MYQSLQDNKHDDPHPNPWQNIKLKQIWILNFLILTGIQLYLVLVLMIIIDEMIKYICRHVCSLDSSLTLEENFMILMKALSALKQV